MYLLLLFNRNRDILSVCIRHLTRTRYRNTCRPSDILRAPAGNRTFHFFAIVEKYHRHTPVHRNKCIVTKSKVIINNLREYYGIKTFSRTIAMFRVLLENTVNSRVLDLGPLGIARFDRNSLLRFLHVFERFFLIKTI